MNDYILSAVLFVMLAVSLFFNWKFYRDFIAWKRAYKELQESYWNRSPGILDHIERVSRAGFILACAYGVFTLYRKIASKKNDETPVA